MIQQPQIDQFTELLNSAQTVFIVFSAKATYDQQAAAASLHLSLTERGYQARLLSPGKSPEKTSLAGVEQVMQEMGNQNLVISFDYDEAKVDKVSYHIGEKTNKFYLTIKPKQGTEPLAADEVEFSYAGAEVDLVILVGVQNLEELEQLYYGYEDVYRNSPVVSINSYETDFGTLKLDASGSASLSEAVTNMLLTMQLPLGADAATNLLGAIEDSTNGFRSFSATATTFETVAQLMRLGARRIRSAAPESGVKEVKQASPNPVAIKKPSGSSETVLSPESSDKNSDKSSSKSPETDTEKKLKSERSKQSDKKSKKNKPKPGGLDYQPSSVAPRSG